MTSFHVLTAAQKKVYSCTTAVSLFFRYVRVTFFQVRPCHVFFRYGRVTFFRYGRVTLFWYGRITFFRYVRVTFLGTAVYLEVCTHI